MRLAPLVLAATLSMAVACNDSPTEPTTKITFTGTTTIRDGTTIPANARVLVVWGVSAASPDYDYVYGSGTISPSGAVTISFDGPPPVGALNAGELGVGLVIVTTDQTLSQGIIPANYSFPGLIGASEDYSIIYTTNLSAEIMSAFPWSTHFNGYGLGKVVRNPTGFDDFTEVDPTSLQLVIDAMSNIHPPNWT